MLCKNVVHFRIHGNQPALFDFFFFQKTLILAFMLYIYTFLIHFSPLYKHGKAKYFWQKFQRYVLRIAYLHNISTHNLIPTLHTYMYVCKWMPAVFYSRSQNKVRDQGTKTTNRYCKSLNLCSIEHVKREDVSKNYTDI